HVVLVAQQRTMEELRSLVSKSAKQKNLARRAFQEVGAAHDFGDAHGSVVNNHCELVRGDVIAAPDKEVGEVMAGGELLPAAIAIREGDGFTIRNLKAPAHTRGRVPIPGVADPAAAGAGIAKLIITLVRSFERALQIFARTGARIDEAAVAQFAPRVEIEIAPLALCVRTKSSAGIGPFLPG